MYNFPIGFLIFGSWEYKLDTTLFSLGFQNIHELLYFILTTLDEQHLRAPSNNQNTSMQNPSSERELISHRWLAIAGGRNQLEAGERAVLAYTPWSQSSDGRASGVFMLHIHAFQLS